MEKAYLWFIIYSTNHVGNCVLFLNLGCLNYNFGYVYGYWK